MMLSDVRDYIESLSLAEHVYSGKLDAKEEKSIGVYNSKHCHAYSTALGGRAMESYGTRYVTFLVHWSRFQRETERRQRPCLTQYVMRARLPSMGSRSSSYSRLSAGRWMSERMVPVSMKWP